MLDLSLIYAGAHNVYYGYKSVTYNTILNAKSSARQAARAVFFMLACMFTEVAAGAAFSHTTTFHIDILNSLVEAPKTGLRFYLKDRKAIKAKTAIATNIMSNNCQILNDDLHMY